ncbi:hypothetical protein QBC37DRAFT_381026 [Rhypophila decipiens]|uniref:Uncharacterized protein n=1 Tax=Rhypophila decipiens TaxID=261697 RepID=A0AAN6XTA4_9PEZI|nr:hypothetical protein QBC37DRAFT_381026 [Rhypophila decipiens]
MGFLLFLDALSCDQNKKSDGVSLPSWVPNWTTVVADSASDNCVKTSTTHMRRPAFRILREKGELGVWGYARTVDMVNSLGHKKKARYNNPRRSGISVPPSDMPESGYLGTVGSRGADGWETGLLIRGRATQGDALVYVPGNFYHLVLSRRAKGDDGVERWVVVGLVLFKRTERARDTIVDPRLRHLADLGDLKHLKVFILI